MNPPPGTPEERRVRLIWFTLGTIALAGAIVRSALGPLLGPLMGEFRLSHAEAGILAASFFYTYALTQLPAGYLCDRLGQRTMLLAGSTLWAAATLWTGLAGSFAALLLLRLLAGMAQGTYFTATRTLVGAIAPRRAALGQGIIGAAGGVGMWMGMATVGFLADVAGWRWSFVLISLPSFAGALLAYLFLPRAAPSREQPSPIPLRSALGRLRQREFLLMCFSGFSVAYAGRLVDSWGPLMFQEIGVESLTRASFLAGLFGIAPAPASVLMGYLSDRMLRRGWGRKGLILAMLALQTTMVGLGAWAVSGTGHVGVLGFSFFILGVTRGFWAPFTALFTEVVPPEGRATLLGVANGFWMMASVLSPWIAGWLHDLTGGFAAGMVVAFGIGLAGALLFVGFRQAPRPRSQEAPGHRAGA